MLPGQKNESKHATQTTALTRCPSYFLEKKINRPTVPLVRGTHGQLFLAPAVNRTKAGAKVGVVGFHVLVFARQLGDAILEGPAVARRIHDGRLRLLQLLLQLHFLRHQRFQRDCAPVRVRCRDEKGCVCVCVQARKGYSLHSTSTEALLLTFAVQIVIVTAVISATGAAHGGVQALAALFAAGKVHVERGKGYGSGRGWVQPPLHRPKLLMAPQKGEWAKRSRMVQWKAT